MQGITYNVTSSTRTGPLYFDSFRLLRRCQWEWRAHSVITPLKTLRFTVVAKFGVGEAARDSLSPTKPPYKQQQH